MKEDIKNIETLRKAISAMLTRVSEGITSEKEQVIVKAAQAAAKAAEIFAADAQNHANLVTETITGDTVSHNIALEAESIFVRLTAKTKALTKDLVDIVTTGDLDLLIDTLDKLEELTDAADKLVGNGDTPEQMPKTPVVDTLPEVEDEVIEDKEEPNTKPPTQDAPVMDPFDNTGGTDGRNVSPYSF